MDQLAINVTQLAKTLNIGRNAAYALVNQQSFYPAIRLGNRRVLVSIEALQRWLSEQTQAEDGR